MDELTLKPAPNAQRECLDYAIFQLKKINDCNSKEECKKIAKEAVNKILFYFNARLMITNGICANSCHQDGVICILMKPCCKFYQQKYINKDFVLDIERYNNLLK